jgi:hypothetical protein
MSRTRLTIAEKEARGTRQECLERKPRTVADVQADVDWQLETLESLKLTARQASESIKTLGPVVPNGRGSENATKANPAIRIQAWALTMIRQAQRELVLLNEELQLTQAKEAIASLALDDEFAGL